MLSDEEMIANYLKNNEIKVIEACDVSSNEQTRKNNIHGIKMLNGINARTVERFTCKCGRVDSVVNKNNTRKYGFVNGKYVGDKLCSYCRDIERAKTTAEDLKIRRDIKVYGSVRKRKIFDSYMKGTKKDSIIKMDRIHLIYTILKLKLAIKINDIKVARDRLNIAEECLKKIEVNHNPEWDDWDTPLTNIDDYMKKEMEA